LGEKKILPKSTELLIPIVMNRWIHGYKITDRDRIWTENLGRTDGFTATSVGYREV
jgi:hypothetical protein